MSSAGSSTPGARTQSSELVSLAERMGYLQALRVGFAVVVLASGLFASNVIGASIADLTLFTAAYLLLSATAGDRVHDLIDDAARASARAG